MKEMNDCEHKYVIKSEDAYIPDYSMPSTTCQPCPVLVPVQQYECLCCGVKFGYIPMMSKLVNKPV